MDVRTEDELDTIIVSYSNDRLSGDRRPLQAWISDHPDLSNNLIQWATELPALASAEERPADSRVESSSLAIGQAILRRMGFVEQMAAPLTSLNDGARARGMKPRDLAAALGIGMSLFAKLNRRLIHARTLPTKLVERLAFQLKISTLEIGAYLAQPPVLAEGAAYRADQVPESGDAQDFLEAVRTSPDMTDEQKGEWF